MSSPCGAGYSRLHRAAFTTMGGKTEGKPVDEIKILPPYSNQFIIFGCGFLIYVHTTIEEKIAFTQMAGLVFHSEQRKFDLKFLK